MPLPDRIALREATDADLPHIAALREAVDWRAHEWALRLALTPPGRCLVAIHRDEIVAVGSGVAFAPIGVVGNMVVAEGHRRRGIGAAILEAVIADLQARGCAVLELYATSEGRPLYARQGFVLDGATISVEVPSSARLTVDPSLTVDRAGPDELVEIVAWDAKRWGGDRAAVLHHAVTDPVRPMLAARRGGALVGYAWLRAEDGRLGPFLADDAATAEALIAATRPLSDAERLAFTYPEANEVAHAWVADRGLVAAPWDGHMVRGGPLPRRWSAVWGSVVGALG